MKKFSEAEAITITLSGVELFAFMAKAANFRDFANNASPEGARAYKRAADKINQQLREQGYLP